MRTGAMRVAAVQTIALGVALSGCSSDLAEPTGSDLPVFRAAAEPALEIGVLDGAEDYSFGRLAGVIRLDDGGLAVSDAMSNRISVFEPDGTIRLTFGGEGEGPGEFRSLSRIYARGDSLFAFDARGGRLSVFDTDGEYLGQGDRDALGGDAAFRLDVWLYGRYWIDGGLDAASRERVRSTLDRLPSLRGVATFRIVRVAEDGSLWIRAPESGPTHRWTVVSSDGSPQAVIDTPSRLSVDVIEDGRVSGRWRDESEVHFVRTYALEEPDERTPAPAWLLASEAAASTDVAPDADEFRAAITRTIMGMARAQEIHYSENYSYTADIGALGDQFQQPEDISVYVIDAGTRGWAAVYSHPQLNYICALSYGTTEAVGWSPGAITCADDPANRGTGDPGAGQR